MEFSGSPVSKVKDCVASSDIRIDKKKRDSRGVDRRICELRLK
jgi:hypothetical protein